MTDPCGSKDVIDKTSAQVDKLTRDHGEIDFRLRLQGEHVAQIKDASNKMIESFDTFANRLHETVASIKEQQIKDGMKTGQLRKEIELLFAERREMKDVVIPTVKEEITKVRSAFDVRIAECAEKKIVPLVSRVKTLEDNHLVEGGKTEGFIDAVRTAKFLIPTITAIVALFISFRDMILGK